MPRALENRASHSHLSSRSSVTSSPVLSQDPSNILGTALHKAAEIGKADVGRCLISKGAEPGIADANGGTPRSVLKSWETGK